MFTFKREAMIMTAIMVIPTLVGLLLEILAPLFRR
jgi:hypothetical protein